MNNWKYYQGSMWKAWIWDSPSSKRGVILHLKVLGWLHKLVLSPTPCYKNAILWPTYLINPSSNSYFGIWPFTPMMSKAERVVTMLMNSVSSAKYRPGQVLHEKIVVSTMHRACLSFGFLFVGGGMRTKNACWPSTEPENHISWIWLWIHTNKACRVKLHWIWIALRIMQKAPRMEQLNRG